MNKKHFKQKQLKQKSKMKYGVGGILLAAVMAAVFALTKTPNTISSDIANPNTENLDTANSDTAGSNSDTAGSNSDVTDLDVAIPEYSGCAFTIVNDNQPYFTEEDLEADWNYEYYGNLDTLGRCTIAEAMVSKDSMPAEKRGDISSVHPTGFVNQSYGDLVESDYLYNRCHLIAFSLAGENDNECNLITGTNYMNLQGMNPFETYVRNYLNDTGNHVFYRVTPIFEGENLVASGVLMEAKSIEDDGICFCIYAYNVQPGVSIDYATGENERSNLYADYIGNTTDYIGEVANGNLKSYQAVNLMTEATDYDYVVNINTGRVHKKSCASVADIHSTNLRYYKGNYEDLIQNGYILCNRCF